MNKFGIATSEPSILRNLLEQNLKKYNLPTERNANSIDWLKAFKRKKSSFWSGVELDYKNSLQKNMLRHVPAYKSFISSLNAKNERLPHITKANYFKAYPHRLQRWKSHANNSSTLTATSGSTGSAAYFFRDNYLDHTYAAYLEYFIGQRPHKKILFIDCFGMGVWIGGLLTYTALREAANTRGGIDILTPGVSFKDIFLALENLAEGYDSVILSGYPPFIKDILDDSRFPKSLLKSGTLRFVFAAESFTEGFREYIAKKAHVGSKYLDTMNIYGSAELGAMAVETPQSIRIRELISSNKQLKQKYFIDGKIPTIAQYNPLFTSFTEREGRVLISGNSITPFHLYDIGDQGKVFSFDEIRKILRDQGISLVGECAKYRLPSCELPFVFVYERADFSVSLYGLLVYPQHIKIALEPFVDKEILTGKFILSSKRNTKQDQYLEIRAEMQSNTKPSKKMEEKIGTTVLESLLERNSEFRELAKHVTLSRIRPHIHLETKGDARYFPAGIKQKWVL